MRETGRAVRYAQRTAARPSRHTCSTPGHTSHPAGSAARRSLHAGEGCCPSRRAYWMARHEAGESLSALAIESGIRREVLSLVATLRRRGTARAGGSLATADALAHGGASVRDPGGPAPAAEGPRSRRHRDGCPGQCLDGVSDPGATRPQSVASAGAEVIRRHEKTRPGELVHLDVKFVPALRNAPWDFEFGPWTISRARPSRGSRPSKVRRRRWNSCAGCWTRCRIALNRC